MEFWKLAVVLLTILGTATAQTDYTSFEEDKGTILPFVPQEIQTNHSSNTGLERIRAVSENFVMELFAKLKSLSEAIPSNQVLINKQLNKKISDQAYQIKHLSQQISLLQGREDPSSSSPVATCDPQPVEVPKCSQVTGGRSGHCRMKIGQPQREATVYIERQRFGGDWIVVLHRFDGSVDFNRTWDDYRDGFGSLEGEFWLGLEALFQLTNHSGYELLFELEDYRGNYGFARYDSFSIGSEMDYYPFVRLGSYSGTAGNSFKDDRGYQFSTFDKGPQRDCSRTRSGGWWYNNCYNVHFTGMRENLHERTSMVWLLFGSVRLTPLRYTRMMIRKL